MKRVLPMILLFLCIGAPAAQAQRQPRAQLEQRVRRAFADRLQRELQLSAEQSRGLQDVMRWSEEQRRAIGLDMRQLGLDTQRFLDGEGEEAEALKLLEARRRMQEREAALFAEEQGRLLEALSPGQVVRFYQLRDQLQRRAQQLRPGGPPGGGRQPGS